MAERKAVVIAVDGLRASALGTYGNTWHETPALDALAAQSVVVDWMYRESPGLAGFYESVWNHGALPRAWADAGVATSLVTDDGEIAELGDAASFGEVLRFHPGSHANVEKSTDDIAETALAGLLAVAADRLHPWSGGDSGGRMLWVHARGFHGPWDAPLALRAELLEEGDPDAPTLVAPPRFEATDDHDALLGYRTAYAAQTIVLDECMGGLLAALAETGAGGDTLVVLVGCRGFALGEHGAVGGDVVALYGETLHVPCLLRAPNLAPAPPRWPQLATPRDLHATLARWFGVESADGRRGTDLLAIDGPSSFDLGTSQLVRAMGERGERMLRTPSWLLRQPRIAAAELATVAVELYVKPDDRWEANEIAARCPEVVEQLLADLDGGSA